MAAPRHAATPKITKCGCRTRAQVYGERWEIVRPLGEGGQAHTFHVRDLTDGSTGYVLKRLSNVNRQGRFDREIGVLKRLDVRGIPPIIDSGVDDRGRGFLVVPFAGTDLTKLEVSDDLIQTIAIFRQVVEAVAAAHSVGVIHRDIKPNNVVMDDDGVVSLIDFGICSDIPGTSATASRIPRLFDDLTTLLAATATPDLAQWSTVATLRSTATPQAIGLIVDRPGARRRPRRTSDLA